MNDNPKVILLLISRFEFGGIPIQAFLWAKFLKKENFHPIILAQYIHDSRYLELLRENEIPFDFLITSDFNGSKKASVKYFLRLVKCLNSFNPVYIFPFNKHLSYHINLIWRFTGAKKAYFMERNHGLEDFISFPDKIMKYFCWINCSGLIFNSYSASLNSPFPKKTFVIKNSHRKFDIKSSNVFKNISFQEKDIVLLHVANIVSQKNYSLLIKGWNLIRKINKNFKLVIIGSDIKNDNHNLIHLFSKYGVFYLGKVVDISPYLQRANVCLLSTHHEGCPNVILEYMDSGKLISASDIPAIREVLDPLNYKYLFDNQSPIDLMEKVLAICKLSQFDKSNLINKNKQKLDLEYSDSNYEKILSLIND
ncbi:glycosyltransferase [Algoriphagus zhangzhouensis]|uniref:Glycosyltransferase involved in cell wall bisynthesis n=1 Tax=Algoriphagus zhangzhouensis TaxID=1073327 RepID=A0A1M7ZL33_9BACT|nr:glycosyltransferase [Algoriphagus zhangzhouensis]TDY42873.1 glycosyltransferase involved in cell wall biosynthesis [Algoriphagus zhangzhouensis]SHO65386.1 Glycosyltransferase involved in cell wall bisynthesis [Algoriphagus zhangzhouensis]